jgi:peroxiredoxin family protein
VPSDRLGILLLSGSHDRAHYAFVIATGAAALDRAVTFFATNAGCRALLADWSGLTGAAGDKRLRARGVAGLDTLREAATELGIRLIVCEAGLRGEALEQAPLYPGVEIAGIATFLAATKGGQLLSL